MIYNRGPYYVKRIMMIATLANYVLKGQFFDEFKSNCGLVDRKDVKNLRY